MAYVNSYIKITDNSGGLLLYCIKIYGKTKNKSIANIGDLIIASLKRVSLKKKKLKQGTLIKAVIVRISKTYKQIDGIYLTYADTAAVILNNKNMPFGNRIFGPIPKILIKKGFVKLLSISYATI